MFNRVPPLHLLIAFEAAARLGSFARAAEELSVTPSAVSHRITHRHRAAPGHPLPGREGGRHGCGDPLRHRALPRPEDHQAAGRARVPGLRARVLRAHRRPRHHQARAPAQPGAAAQPAGTLEALVRDRGPGLARASGRPAIQRHRPDARSHRLQPGGGPGAPAHGPPLAVTGPDGTAAGHRIGIAARLLHRRARTGAAQAGGAVLRRLAAQPGLVAPPNPNLNPNLNPNRPTDRPDLNLNLNLNINIDEEESCQC
ncbi:LysR family transcriptional regulator [Cupriavidus basilensis OR16]|uniref:LysR family transcriptional regulator n=1 Tax=Cupriavidus basilensis OR16 TaxID=1127483 RepID=H1S2C4_9BURK|nr:LysR family transcriptional regulator [Cupriavidus basilensis OR16]